MDQHEQMLSAWSKCFARKQRFVALRIYNDPASLHQQQGVAQATKRWFASGAHQQIGELVKAMLIVVPETEFARMQSMSVQKVFGIPGGIHASLGSAIGWLEANTAADPKQMAAFRSHLLNS